MSRPDLDDGSALMRLIGISSLAVRRVIERATGAEARRVWLSIGGVAIAIGLMLVVTGVGLGLSAGSTVRSDSVDYWILPESSGSSTAVVSTGGTQFGGVHTQNAYIQSMEQVDYSTPMLMQLLRVQAPESEESEYVLALGIIPSAGTDSVAGISTAGFTPGDPYYANGSYDGEWTGDVVLSPAGAEILNASTGQQLQVFTTSPRAGEFSVRNVSATEAGTGFGQMPIAVFRLSELQTIAGADAGDQADQILVSTNVPGIKDDLGGVYPRSTVVTRSGLSAGQVANSDLPLAVSITAFIVSLIVGTLFVATTMGLEIVADRQQLAVLAAIGFQGRDRALLVLVQTLCVTALGGVLGILLGIGGIALANAFAADLVGGTVARFHPALAGYGLGVALLIGLLSAPYLLVMTRRTDTLEALAY